ncbi:hypothetical protein CONLIGDRAFT_683328 [Coniochaeta ligniaria NRRL 30616]|uniref:Small secreted protein n=1 Tax=Coniochaeta ligniaria NRRL 30616 TaxID=1408157 RepID=A0A1J7JAU5_9PEZI|nr:hypothetical protein CONLIGDRAFT_683328 [Coniochaeta ligniaria NRRL 30616]
MFVLTLLQVAMLLGSALAQFNQTATYLNLTAISARDGESILECWEVGPIIKSSVPGTSGASSLFFGETTNATYTIIPPRFDGGLHTAPAVQLVFFVAGLIHVSLPNRTDEAWVQGGKYGLIIAADTANISTHGHRTQYPGNEATVALQVPFASTGLKYGVLHRGACNYEEMAFL